MRIVHLTHKEQLAYCQLRSMAWQNAIGEKELAQLFRIRIRTRAAGAR